MTTRSSTSTAAAGDNNSSSSTMSDQAPAISFNTGRARQAVAEWLKANGEQTLLGLGTVFMWSAAAHAAYLAVVPEPLRVSVAKRNQRLWKRMALGSLLGVALYDGLHSAVLTGQQQQQAAEAKRIRAELQRYTDPAA